MTETSARAEFAPPQWQEQVADRADRLIVTASWLRDRLADAGVASSPVVARRGHRPVHSRRRDEALRASWTDGDLTQVVVGYVGSLRKRHGVRRLAEVARVPGTRLVVVGDGPQQAWLRGRLPDSVRFTGELRPREAAAAMASLDLLVQPEHAGDLLPRPARGRGVRGALCRAAAGGAADVVEHLETGLLYDPATPLGLVDAVAAVVADPPGPAG